MARTRTEKTALTIPTGYLLVHKNRTRRCSTLARDVGRNLGKYFTLQPTDRLQPHKVYSEEAIREELTRLRR